MATFKKEVDQGVKSLRKKTAAEEFSPIPIEIGSKVKEEKDEDKRELFAEAANLELMTESEQQTRSLKRKREIPEIYYCVQCDYKTFQENSYNSHLLTLKHKNNTSGAFEQDPLAEPEAQIIIKGTEEPQNKKGNTFHKGYASSSAAARPLQPILCGPFIIPLGHLPPTMELSTSSSEQNQTNRAAVAVQIQYFLETTQESLSDYSEVDEGAQDKPDTFEPLEKPNENGAFKCPCGLSYLTQDQLRRHQNKIHCGWCKLCERNIKQRHLVKHMICLQHIHNLSCAEDKKQLGRLYSYGRYKSLRPKQINNEVTQLIQSNYIKPKIFPIESKNQKKKKKSKKAIPTEPTTSNKHRGTVGRNDKYRIDKQKLSDEISDDSEESEDSDTLSDYSEVNMNRNEHKKEKKLEKPTKRGKFKCPCGVSYLKEVGLKRHQKQVHCFTCELCLRDIKQRHIDLHQTSKQHLYNLKCPPDKRELGRLYSYGKMRKPDKSIKGVDGLYHCPCGKSFAKPSELKRHRVDHGEKVDILCKVCNKNVLKDSYRLHLKSKEHFKKVAESQSFKVQVPPDIIIVQE